VEVLVRVPALSVTLLLAALLAFGSEVLVWQNPLGRAPLDWLPLAAGYLALAALALDFIARYRIRDLFGLLTLSGLISLTGALCLHPDTAFADLPRTLATRVMGAHALLAAEMLGLFLVLTGDSVRLRKRLGWGCVVVGLAWGVWAAPWSAEEGYAIVSLPTLLLWGAGGVLLLVLLLRWAARSRVAQDDLRLPRLGMLGALAVLGALLAAHILRGALANEPLIFTALLGTLCWAILWYRGRATGATLLDGRLPPQPPGRGLLIAAGVLFFGAAIFGYNLPAFEVGGVTPFRFIGLGFTAYGLAWLPGVSLVLGVGGYLRQMSAQKL